MATQRINILGSRTRPLGPVFPQPASILQTTAPWEGLDFIFPFTATRDQLAGSFSVPPFYVDTANLIIVWTTAATSLDVEWDFDYRAIGGNDTESYNQAGTQESVNDNDTAPSVTLERMELSIALTDGNFAAGDSVDFGLFRDQTDAGDTLTVAVILKELLFEYNDA